MKIEIVNLSKSRTNGVNTFEATFSVDGELQPLRVSAEDRSDSYNQIAQLLASPEIDLEKAGLELYKIMSPIAKVKETIESDLYLAGSMSIVNGTIKFGDHLLEESLSNHILSLLDDNNVPKDAKLWKSYVAFLDNLHQNVNQDIREQLFRWISYENNAGHGFGFTEDGCIVGYKGTGGTILEPMSKFTGTAIVDGVEITGHIPNKVGSVVKMPRSAVQFDPKVGCSAGLHVGTRDYATSWAPILLLVKVNPRDIVSVPYEVNSQKMRVCEYTVLEVTDTTSEHKRFYESTEIEEETLSDDLVMSVEDANELLHKKLHIECEDGSSYNGILTEVDTVNPNKPEISIKNDFDEYEYIDLSSITLYMFDGSEKAAKVDNHLKDLVLTVEDAQNLVGEEIHVDYGGNKSFQGTVSEVFTSNSSKPGVIIRNDSNEYKHIKLNRITSWTSEVDSKELVLTLEDAKELLGKEIYIEYGEDKDFEGIVSNVFESVDKPGIVLRNEDEVYKHIKLDKVTFYSENKDESVEETLESVLSSLTGKKVEITTTLQTKMTGIMESFLVIPNETLVTISSEDNMGSRTFAVSDLVKIQELEPSKVDSELEKETSDFINEISEIIKKAIEENK